MRRLRFGIAGLDPQDLKGSVEAIVGAGHEDEGMAPGRSRGDDAEQVPGIREEAGHTVEGADRLAALNWFRFDSITAA